MALINRLRRLLETRALETPAYDSAANDRMALKTIMLITMKTIVDRFGVSPNQLMASRTVTLRRDEPTLSPPAMAVATGSSVLMPTASATPPRRRQNRTRKGLVSSARKKMLKTRFMLPVLSFRRRAWARSNREARWGTQA